MSVCEQCRAPVVEARTEEGERVVLEVFEETPSGDSFLVLDYSARPWVVAPHDGRTLVEGYMNHKVRCPFQ
jgi:hypothetical protein